MAIAKKKTTRTAKKTNGDAPLYRLKGDDRVNAIVEKYPQLDKPITELKEIFEVVSPNEARAVSGYVQSRIAAFCKTRLDERQEFQKQQKLDRLAAKEEQYREKLDELNKLRDELGVSA